MFFSFDDESLPWRDNLHLTLERPQKYEGNPVLTAGPQGSVDGNGALLYGTVLQEGGKFRMWYIAQPQPDPKAYPENTNSSPYRPVGLCGKRGWHSLGEAESWIGRVLWE